MFNCNTHAAIAMLILVSIPVITSVAVFGSTPVPEGSSLSSTNATLGKILHTARGVASEHVQGFIARQSFAAGKKSVVDQLDDMCADKIDSILSNQAVSEDLLRFTPGDLPRIVLAGVLLFVVGWFVTNSSWRKLIVPSGQIVTPDVWNTLTPEQKKLNLNMVNQANARSSSPAPTASTANDRTDMIVRTPDQDEAVMEINVQKRNACQITFNKVILMASVVVGIPLGLVLYSLARAERKPQTNWEYYTQHTGSFIAGFMFGADVTSRDFITTLLGAAFKQVSYAAVATLSVSAMSVVQLVLNYGIFPRFVRRAINRRLAEVRAEAAADTTSVRRAPAQRASEPSAPEAEEDSEEDRNDSRTVFPPGTHGINPAKGRIAKNWSPNPQGAFL